MLRGIIRVVVVTLVAAVLTGAAFTGGFAVSRQVFRPAALPDAGGGVRSPPQVPGSSRRSRRLLEQGAGSDQLPAWADTLRLRVHPPWDTVKRTRRCASGLSQSGVEEACEGELGVR